MSLRILAIGDVCGSAGVEYLRKNLRGKAARWS